MCDANQIVQQSAWMEEYMTRIECRTALHGAGPRPNAIETNERKSNPVTHSKTIFSMYNSKARMERNRIVSEEKVKSKDKRREFKERLQRQNSKPKAESRHRVTP